MEKASTSGGGLALARTQSEQLVVAEGGTPSRRWSRRMTGASPGRKNSSHIRKSRSAQMKFDLDELASSGAALSRASSASLGLSFSFTGFTVPPDEIADSKPFSDDDIRTFPSLFSLPSFFIIFP